MKNAFRFVVLVVLMLGSFTQAQMLANQGPPQHRIVHKNTFALRYNPLGLLYDGRFAYRYRLYKNDSKILRDNFLGVGIAPTASPAFLRIGPYVEFNPLTILGFWATIQYVQYFGSFDLLQSFPSAQSTFSDTAIKANTANRQATNGWELTIGANLQFKVGPVVVRSLARVVNGNMNLRSGDTVYYDQFYDVLAPNRGWYLTNDLDVMWQGLDDHLLLGARYTATAPFYDQRQLDPNLPVEQANNAMHRVGPFAGYTFFMEDGRAFNSPTVFLLVQWWLQSKYRTGADVSQALPLMGVGFQFSGDFLPIN